MSKPRKVSCPYCGLLKSGRYDTKTRLFTCTNGSCKEFGSTVDYSAFVAEINRQREEFFDQLPGLAPGSSESQIKDLAWELLSKKVDPYLSLRLVASWNEVQAKPPVSRSRVPILATDDQGQKVAECQQMADSSFHFASPRKVHRCRIAAPIE